MILTKSTMNKLFMIWAAAMVAWCVSWPKEPEEVRDRVVFETEAILNWLPYTIEIVENAPGKGEEVDSDCELLSPKDPQFSICYRPHEEWFIPEEIWENEYDYKNWWKWWNSQSE